MRFGSVCSGIEAASAAWAPLGWQAQFVSEIEAFPRAVLKHRHPSVPLHGDFTTIQQGDYDPIDLLVGGTPCQSFSIAGLRKGMADDRGNLALEYLRLADRLRPKWLVWENVPGVLSSNGGRDFGSFLGGLGELGYGFAYRVLDAQFFGLAQRRKRVFVVGYLGDWRRAAAVLFEPASLRGDPAPRREAGTGVAGALAGVSPGGGWRCGADEAAGGQLIPQVATALRAREGAKGVDSDCTDTLLAFGGNNTAGPIQVATALSAHGGPMGRMDFESETFIAHTLRGEGFDASEDGTGRRTPLVPCAIPFDTTQITSALNRSSPKAGDPCHPLAAGAHPPAIAFSCKDHGADATDDLSPTLRAMGHAGSHANAGGQMAVAFQQSQSGMRVQDTHATLDANNGSRRHNGVMAGSAVRRLTPRECERLQGFDDDYTLIPTKAAKRIEDDLYGYLLRAYPQMSRQEAERLAKDGPRYKALGNSMAVPVMRWIGERIAMVESFKP